VKVNALYTISEGEGPPSYIPVVETDFRWAVRIPEIAWYAIKCSQFCYTQRDMTAPAGPCDLVAASRIDSVMRAVKKSLLPPTNVTEEVSALHDMYLERKGIIAMIDDAHNTLRHLQRVESKKRGHRAARQTRVPRAPAVAATNTAVATKVENVPCGASGV